MHLKNDKIQSVRNIQFKVNLSANSNSQCYNFPLLRLSVNCLLYILPDIVYAYVYLQLNTCIYNIDGTLYSYKPSFILKNILCSIASLKEKIHSPTHVSQSSHIPSLPSLTWNTSMIWGSSISRLFYTFTI